MIIQQYLVRQAIRNRKTLFSSSGVYRERFLNLSSSSSQNSKSFRLLQNNGPIFNRRCQPDTKSCLFCTTCQKHQRLPRNQYRNCDIIDQTRYFGIQASPPLSPQELSQNAYEEIVDESLESLYTYFDEVLESSPVINGGDVSYSSGVLTVKLGKHGTYVINKQTPNRQIWLSSPTSGPKRYDYINKTWIYKHDGVSFIYNASQLIVVRMAFKVTDLFLAEKNFIDFVEKNLGQERDRLKNDELETDIVCSHLAGGILDYPLMISHDFADITTAIDIYVDAFTRDARNMIPKPYAYGVFKKDASKNDRIGKMPFRGDELTVKQFINAILGACPKMRSHIIDCTDEVTSTGRLENLYVIISNVVMIRNYIWTFLEVFEADNKPKLKVEYKEYCDLTEILSEQMLQIFGNLLTTFILHDEQSQCFSHHRPYYEGERGSPIIPMWIYFIKGMQRDMWSILPPQLAQRILAIIVNDSLAIICARYVQIRPTESTTPQYVVDILNVLTAVEELLFFISPDLASVCGQMDPSSSKTLYSIHLKCHCLTAGLLLVGCPLEVLYKNFRRGLSSCSLMDSRIKSQTHLTEPSWMSAISLLCPKFYPTGMEYCDWDLLYNLKLLCAQPSINWPLVYKVLTMNDCKIGSFILTLFPKISAPVGFFLLEGHGFIRCKFVACMNPHCHGLPKTLPNHFASSCTLYIIANALPWDVLPRVYRNVLPLIEDWSVMDKAQIWNSKKRPVWFQSLVDILLPVLKTCVQSLILIMSENVNKPLSATTSTITEQKITSSALVPNSTRDVSDVTSANVDAKATTTSSSNSKPTRRRGSVSAALNVGLDKEEELLTQWVIELLNAVTEVLSIIPRGFFVVCEEMDDLIPRKFIPVRNNVPVHFLVTALYILLNLGTSIIASIIEEETVLPKNEPKIPPAKDTKKNRTTNKRQPSPVPSVSSHLEPCLLSVAERLCYLCDPVFDQSVHRLVTTVESMIKHTKANHDKTTASSDIMTDFAMECDISHLKADFLMENAEGQLALRLMYWFILSHGTMLQSVITGAENISKDHKGGGKMHPPVKTVQKDNTPSAPNSKSMPQVIRLNMNILKIVPKIRTSFTPVNIIHEFHYVNKYRTFDEILWEPKGLDWVQTIRQCKLGLQKQVIGKMLEKRWEFKQTTEEEMINSNDEKSIHLLKMVSDIKALILQ